MFTRVTAVLLALALIVMGPGASGSTYLIVKYVLLLAFLLAMFLEDRRAGLVPLRTVVLGIVAVAVMVFLDLTKVSVPVSLFLGVSVVCAIAFFRERWTRFKAAE